ncbi:tRNA-uridine aminocarboxypropyltransferase 2 isoform X2 [Hyla sarda]|uniref:tRNA-uridine aminocarboxypropyltransferase 2 isoform X2 n=1 Tax=Hyla sarda TaxID=327740 RepID=UPI0024C410AD|nr:tRNA-uridine aminocarboxypropyltransferase 2 isoform X2 [Hyla sarda]
MRLDTREQTEEYPNDMMDEDTAHGSKDCAHENLVRPPGHQPCTNALDSSPLHDSNQDTDSQEQSSEHTEREISSLTQENVFGDLDSVDETLSDDDGGFRGLSALPVENSAVRRALCARCSRPEKVCLCPFLPAHPLSVSTCLYIVQHPAEESRVLRTVPLLAACLPEDKCKVLIGRRFGEERYPELAAICRKPGTFLLYPGAEAANLEELSLEDNHHPHSLIIIDGTWSQAKDIFYKNSLFRLPKQVQLKTTISSQYVIRTQPTNTCLSTLECAAIGLSIMEKDTEIQQTILRPLQALCTFQLQHGAQIHHSKEQLLKNGQYKKPMPKNKRKIKKMELLVNNVKI